MNINIMVLILDGSSGRVAHLSKKKEKNNQSKFAAAVDVDKCLEQIAYFPQYQRMVSLSCHLTQVPRLIQG